MAKRTDESLLSLPETTEVKLRVARTKLNDLLQEAHDLKAASERLAKIKEEIQEIIISTRSLRYGEDNKMGARNGNLCAIVRWTNGRKSLNAELLIENGVTPEQIEKSTKEGNGYWVLELPKVGAGEE